MFNMNDIHSDGRESGEYSSWFAGVVRYQNSSFKRYKPDYQVFWQKNQVRCLQINKQLSPNQRTLLIIPSLINRYYILDLTEKLSLVRYLSNNNVNVFLLDWDRPREEDFAFDSASYILQYIQPLMNILREQFNNLHIMGYCIGGLLALASSVCNLDAYKSLILLATPWDFHSDDYNKILWNNLHLQITKHWCDKSPLISGEYIAWLFYLTDPINFAEKYKRFNMLDEGSEAYNRFLAVENWVNDTVPLTSSFARECLIDWACNNMTLKEEWRVGDMIISPKQLKIPTLLVAPQYDKIVPTSNALSIAKDMNNVNILSPKTGHIGAIIGKERMNNLWNPLLEWLKNN
jgi:polyhydroxyalkanoate synthase